MQLAVWLALSALVLQTMLPSIAALARAVSPSHGASIELVLCTPEGLRRIRIADQGADQAPQPTSPVFCPACLATGAPSAISPPVVELACAAGGIVLDAWPSPEGSLLSGPAAAQPPARGPPAP